MALTISWTNVVNTNMFAHCLLPALMLIATLDYCTAKPPVFPPVVTNKFLGSNRNVDKHLKKFFEIKANQSHGDLHVLEIPALRCGYGVGYSNLSLNVTVYDYKPVEIREEGNSVTKVLILRETPVPTKHAIVEVDAGCGPFIP